MKRAQRRKCLQCEQRFDRSPQIWCLLVFEVSRVRCFAYVVISCYAKEIHAAAHTNCFDGIRQSVSVCFSSLRVDDWCTNCCISAKNENNSAILSSHISNFLNFNPTFKCFWWKCTNKNRECDEFVCENDSEVIQDLQSQSARRPLVPSVSTGSLSNQRRFLQIWHQSIHKFLRDLPICRVKPRWASTVPAVPLAAASSSYFHSPFIFIWQHTSLTTS